MNKNLVFNCTNCGADIEAPAELMGKTAECPNCGQSVHVPQGSSSENKEKQSKFAFLKSPYLLYVSLLVNFVLAVMALSVAITKPSREVNSKDTSQIYDVLRARKLVIVGKDQAKLAKLGSKFSEKKKEKLVAALTLYNPLAKSKNKRSVELLSGFGWNGLSFYDHQGREQITLQSNNMSVFGRSQSALRLFDSNGNDRLELTVLDNGPNALSVHAEDGKKVLARFGSVAPKNGKHIGAALFQHPTSGKSMMYTSSGKIDVTELMNILEKSKRKKER